MRDHEGHTALDLLPGKRKDLTVYDTADVVYQTVSEHIRRKSTFKPINPFEKPDDFERLVKMGSGIIPHDEEGEEREAQGEDSEEENVAHPSSPPSPPGEDYRPPLSPTTSPLAHNQDDQKSMTVVSALGQSTQTQHTNDGTLFFQSFLTDAHSIKTVASSESHDLFSLQQLFSQISDRLEQWRQCSEQEYQMTLPVLCWNGCGYQTKFEEMTSHVRDSCSHKPLICGDCSEVHPLYLMKKHLTQECVQRLIACPNTTKGCCQLVPAHYLQTHINLRCLYRLVSCRLHCEKMVLFCCRDDHEQNHCKKRLIACYQCQQLIPSERLSAHMKDACPCRKVQCTKGCYEYFNIRDIEHHETSECIQRCQWAGCGEMIGPLRKRQLHELTECPYRPVECRKECGVKGLIAKSRSDHEENYCRRARVNCPNSCGVRLLRSEVHQHLDPWHGTCPERMVRCPSNLVGWRVLVNNEEEGIVMQYQRRELTAVRMTSAATPETPEASEQEGASARLSDPPQRTHILSPRNLIEKDLSLIPSPDCGLFSWCSNGVDMVLIRFPDRHVWIPYWTSNLIPMRKQIHRGGTGGAMTVNECHWIVFSQLNQHLESQCCHREVLLGQANPLTQLTYTRAALEDYSSETNAGSRSAGMEQSDDKTFSSLFSSASEPHLLTSTVTSGALDTTTEQLMTSLTSFPGQHCHVYDCIPLAIRRHEINEFLVSPPDKVICEHCSSQVLSDQLRWHHQHDCSHVPIRCQLGCGQLILRRNLMSHQTGDCSKRYVNCGECGEEMWADELEKHLEELCCRRLVPCPNNCHEEEGGEGNTGGGGGKAPIPRLYHANELPTHLLQSCVRRIYECECGESYIFCDRSDHLITTCPKRRGLCPQGCGSEITRDQMEEHMEFSCSNKFVFQNKLVVCPLRCGIRLKRLDVLEHVTYRCIMRLVECSLRCGWTGRKEKLESHLFVCPLRELHCEKGMPTCQFKFHQWFCHDGDGEEGEKRKREEEDGEGEEEEEEDDGGIPVRVKAVDTIQAIKGQRFFGSGRLITIPTRTKTSSHTSQEPLLPHELDSIDTTITRTSSSIVIQNNTITLRDELRLLACPSHGRNLLYYAIRFDEMPLLKFLIGKTRGDDLDLQDRYGDTPLTLACRLQKVDFVHALVHYGADVNMETVTGKTPLIEATKVNNKEIVEVLITAGAIVNQKTIKHAKSALDWASIMQLRELQMYLDLGSVVQTQLQEIFFAIAAGDLQKVSALVENGAFFTANNSFLFLSKMEENMRVVKETHEVLGQRTQVMQVQEREWLEVKAIYDTQQQEEERARDVYMQLQKELNQVHLQISGRFELFDKKVALLSSFDIEEIINLRDPTPVTRIAMLAYGLLFSAFETNGGGGVGTGSSVYSYQTDLQSAHQWWPQVMRSLLNKKETLKKLTTFSWVTLQSPYLQGLGKRIQELYHEIILAKEEQQQQQQQQSRQKARLRSGPGHTSSEDSPTATHSITPLTAVAARGGESVESEALVLQQEDWDSDAEDGGDGEWVKGKWVGKVKKKSRWWELKGRQLTENGEEATASTPQGEPKPKRGLVVKMTEMLRQLEEQKNQHLSPQLTDPSSSSTLPPTHETPPSHTPTETIPSSSDTSSTSHSSTSNFDFSLTLPFVESLIILMHAVTEMISDLQLLSSLSRQILDQKLIFDSKKAQTEVLKQKYETVSSKYFMLQSEINSALTRVRKATVKVDSYRDRLRIARLMNQVSSSGHTVMSWAACHGAYEMVEVLLSKGGAVGYNEQLLHYSAEVIQITWRLFFNYSRTMKEKKKQRRREEAKKPAGKRGGGKTSQRRRESVQDNGTDDGGGSMEQDQSDHHSAADSLSLASTGGGGDGGDEEGPLQLSAAEAMNLEEMSNHALGHGVEEIFLLKEKRESIVFRINRLRRNFRFPIPEAAYGGYAEIVSRIQERKLLHHNFLGSWTFPSPPPPRRRIHQRLDLEQKKFSFLQILKEMKKAFSAGVLTSEQGWLPRGDPQDPYVESYHEMKTLYLALQEQIKTYRHHRYIIHQLVLNKIQQLHYQQVMTHAIKTADFKQCIELAQNDFCSIDFETEEGLTALIVASEENIGGLHHHYLLNDDQAPVLAVVYLLDRVERSPAVNIETKTGNTPLLHACALGREHVVEALLDRHAQVNRVNKFGQAALHVAAINGSVRCTRLLLERGANSDLKDDQGMTPYDLALEQGFTSVLTILGQYRGGFYGEITGKRGTINETIGCPSGCGVILHRHEIKDHLPVCILRTIPCPLECSDPNIIARDVELHLALDCPHTLVECPKCHLMVRKCDFTLHESKKCVHRLVLCSLGCEQKIEAKSLVEHQASCLYKLMTCPESCGESYPIIKRLIHMRLHCANRRVVCPNRCSSMVTFHTLSHHLGDICPRRLMTCQWCQDSSIEYQLLVQHELHCNHRLIQCTNSTLCRETIRLINLPDHLENHCHYRFVPCSNSCERLVRQVDLPLHLQEECPNRVILCPSGCMSRLSGVAEERTQLLAKHLPVHLLHECLERVAPCGLCASTMKAKELPYHHRNQCEFRPVPCRNHGCHKTLPCHLRERHERNECKFRFVLCPTGCGTAVHAKKLHVHLGTVCGMRYVSCSLGCGLEVRQSQIGMHLQYECVRRPLALRGGTGGARSPYPQSSHSHSASVSQSYNNSARSSSSANGSVHSRAKIGTLSPLHASRSAGGVGGSDEEGGGDEREGSQREGEAMESPSSSSLGASASSRGRGKGKKSNSLHCLPPIV
jgi:ankyrin repeat protein